MLEIWGRIIGVFVVLIAITFLAQWIVPRGKTKQTARRQYLRRDVAPMVGFFGILILALSIAEAVQKQLIQAWGWGAVLGVTISLALWVTWNYNHSPSHTTHSLWYYIRQFGVPIVIAIIGLYLATRTFGATVQVLVASALGVALLTVAIFIFAKSSVPSNQ